VRSAGVVYDRWQRSRAAFGDSWSRAIEGRLRRYLVLGRRGARRARGKQVGGFAEGIRPPRLIESSGGGISFRDEARRGHDRSGRVSLLALVDHAEPTTIGRDQPCARSRVP